MKNRIVLIEIRFNSAGFSAKRESREWIEYRMNIMMKYTMKSLIKQTCKEFYAFIYYKDETEALVNAAYSKYEKLPSHIKFIPISQQKQAVNALIQGYEYAFITRLDNDDMFNKNYIERIRTFPAKAGTQAIITRNGYVYDINNNRLARITKTSPSFYTYIYKTSDYIRGLRYKSNHTKAESYRYELIDGRNYVINIHEKNTLNKFVYASAADLIPTAKIRKILNEFM